MDVGTWVGLGIFAAGLAVNAGITWKGLLVVESEVLRVRTSVHASNNQNAATLGSMESDIENLKRDVDRLEKKVYGA